MSEDDFTFNAPPGWAVDSSNWTPPHGWNPPPNWTPDPSWPPAPAGWEFWVSAANRSATIETSTDAFAATDDEIRQLRGRVAELEAELRRFKSRPAAAAPTGTVDLDDERVLQEVGIYRYHHPLEHAAAYKERLSDLSDRIKDMARSGEAILASDMFTYNNSLAKGRKMTADFSKLMLRAFNSEADSCIRSLRAGNVVTAKRRLEATATAVSKFGSMMEMQVNPAYHRLRNEELELTSDYLMKLQAEKEAAREERARLREEQKAQKELAAERERLDKERAHYANALAALRASAGDANEIAEIAERLVAIDDAIEHNDYRIANIRAGYVYVISNVGAFGPGVVKIGLTRRLEPLERVRELGGASVPFPFDVHALFFAEDAVSVEAELHRTFAASRVNHVNTRREFFFASPSEVRLALAEKQLGNLLEFVENAEATQYFQSKGAWPESISSRL